MLHLTHRRPVLEIPNGLIRTGHDLLAWRADLERSLAGAPGREAAEYRRRLETDTVARVMSGVTFTIDESAPWSAAASLFLDRRLRRLPVTREGRLMGVLTRLDLLRALAAEVSDGPAGPGTEAQGEAPEPPSPAQSPPQQVSQLSPQQAEQLAGALSPPQQLAQSSPQHDAQSSPQQAPQPSAGVASQQLLFASQQGEAG